MSVSQNIAARIAHSVEMPCLGARHTRNAYAVNAVNTKNRPYMAWSGLERRKSDYMERAP